MFGFVVFVGLFALVAWRPRRIPGVSELTFGHKLSMAVAGLVDKVSVGSIAVACAYRYAKYQNA